MMNPSCTADPADEKYSFYEYINKYIKYERFCYHDKTCNKYNEICKSIGTSVDGKQDTRSNICAGFHYLIEEIIKSTSTSNDSTEYADLAFLNYWLNYELHNKKADIQPREFHQHMRVHDNTNTKLYKLSGKINYIDEEEAKNMYSLFYLYMDYINIIKETTKDDAIEENFIRYTKHCVEKYQQYEDKCHNKTTSFCKALCSFRKKYEQIKLRNDIIKYWTQKTLPSLSKYTNTQVNVFKLPRVLEPTSVADAKIPERVNRDPVTISKSPERDSEGKVTPRVIPRTMTDTDSIVKYGSLQPTAISYLTDESQRDSFEEKEPIEIPKEEDFDTSTNKIIGTSISTVGVSSLFFLFYKVKNK
ncbi:hypothetical protein PVIIG_05356 [Plasmodium vivax India VII]|uniref:Uncharacterized protein n=1 Tax=Plasmodium vivax India VII TaxID=1077284 RepID=A0A0J9SHL2_PLAVI|nr:hypothetical protein PVIIG_05356 [Plasmodium vivax India VII]